MTRLCGSSASRTQIKCIFFCVLLFLLAYPKRAGIFIAYRCMAIREMETKGGGKRNRDNGYYIYIHIGLQPTPCLPQLRRDAYYYYYYFLIKSVFKTKKPLVCVAQSKCAAEKNNGSVYTNSAAHASWFNIRFLYIYYNIILCTIHDVCAVYCVCMFV